MTEEIVTANEVEFMKFVALIEKAMKDVQPQSALAFIKMDALGEKEGIAINVSSLQLKPWGTLAAAGYFIERLAREMPAAHKAEAQRLHELFKKLFGVQPIIIGLKELH